MKKFLIILVVVALVMTLAAPAVVAAPPGPTLVEVALAVNAEGTFAGQFDMLIAAILAADPAVLATLSGNGQFTVFAPTDAAFEALGIVDAGYFENMNQGVLTQILLYHVARGRRDSTSVLGSSRIRTMQRGFLFQSGGVLTDNLGREATIFVTDVPAANGIIHVIDAVLLPFDPYE